MLIVGAMVVGAEEGAIINLSLGVIRCDFGLVLRCPAALAIRFSLAATGAMLLGLTIRAVGLEPTKVRRRHPPSFNLINNPNRFSVIVAARTCVLGVVSLTEEFVHPDRIGSVCSLGLLRCGRGGLTLQSVSVAAHPH